MTLKQKSHSNLNQAIASVSAANIASIQGTDTMYRHIFSVADVLHSSDTIPYQSLSWFDFKNVKEMFSLTPTVLYMLNPFHRLF